MRGRPPRVNQEIIEAIIDRLRIEYDVRSACEYVGIGRTSYYRYLASHPITAQRIEDIGKAQHAGAKGRTETIKTGQQDTPEDTPQAMSEDRPRLSPAMQRRLDRMRMIG